MAHLFEVMLRLRPNLPAMANLLLTCSFLMLLAFGGAATAFGQDDCPGSIEPEQIPFGKCGSDMPILGDIPGAAQQISMTIAPRAVQCFRLKTSGRKYIRAEVLQEGVDVIIQIFKLSGERAVGPVDSPNGRGGVEPAAFITDDGSEYVLAVMSQESVGQQQSGEQKYTVRLPEVRPPNSTDSEYLEAERAVLRGNLSLGTAQQMHAPEQIQGRLKAASAAACNLQRAVTIYRRQGNLTLKIAALNSLSIAYQILGRADEARQVIEELLADAKGSSNEPGQIVANINLGRFYANLRNVERAEKAYKDATEVPGTGALDLRATAWRELGRWYASRHKWTAAIDAYNKAAEGFGHVGDKNGTAEVLTFAGIILFDQSSIPAARTYFEKALTAGPDRQDILGYALYHLGMTLSVMGEKQDALEKLLDAMRHFEEARATNPGDDFVDEGEAYVWANLGMLYAKLGQYQTGLTYTEKSLELAETGGMEGKPRFPLAAAYARQYRGMNLLGLQKRGEANSDFEKALGYWRAAGDRRGEAMAIVNLGAFLYDRREYQEALQYLARAQELQQHPDVNDIYGLAYTLTNIGRILGDLGRNEEGLSKLQAALPLRKKVGDREGEAITLYTIGLLKSRLGHYRQAHDQLSMARAIADDLRREVGHENLRASFFSTVRRIYELDVSVLARLGLAEGARTEIEESLTLNDNARARSLVEVIAAGRVSEGSVADPELLSKAQQLRDRLSALRGRMLFLQQNLGPAAQATPRAEAERQAVAVSTEINAVVTELQLTEARIERANPGLSVIINPPRLSVSQMRELLDPETVLLEYALGEDRCFLWVLTKDGREPLRLLELQARSGRIEELASKFRELLRSPQTDESEVQVKQLSTDLSQILIKPAQPYITNKKLVIVADGILQYIPFGALGGLESAKWQPLIKEHEIIKLPSMAALAAIRQKPRQVASQALALITDPTYEPGNRAPTSVRNVPPSTRLAPPLEQLVFAQDEKNSLERIFSGAQGPVKVWEGPEANRQNATSPALKDFRIIHYTAHGKADDAQPETSGIFLSLYGRDGRAVEDYFVGLSDIYRLRLNADLVVLAACETALGKEIKGEGLIGITRGFMYAGTPTVMSSLWEAHQFHTVSLMRIFYESMVQKDMKPTASLREAQVYLWERKKLPPYYWAAFELQGDWR
jgi:CHAT domain-containing protein